MALSFEEKVEQLAPQIAKAMLREAKADEGMDHTDVDEYCDMFDDLQEAVQRELEELL